MATSVSMIVRSHSKQFDANIRQTPKKWEPVISAEPDQEGNVGLHTSEEYRGWIRATSTMTDGWWCFPESWIDHFQFDVGTTKSDTSVRRR